VSNLEKILSASRIKTLETCSWSYWCNYHLKVPQRSNSGAMRGTVCHLVFELLLKKRHLHHYKKILKYNGLEGSPAVDRLIKKHLKKDGILDDGESYELCDAMIVVGLQNDFIGEGGKMEGVEERFLLENEEPEYKVMGFIDKLIKYTKGKVKIVDYKSSKYKFRGEELDSNIQAMVYTLAAKRKYPKAKEVLVEFLFLRFPRRPAQQIHVTEEQLRGFEYYMEHVFKVINSFTEQDAKTNFAESNPKVRWMCKAGKTWRCPYLDPVDYYALLNEEGNVIKSAFKKSDLSAKPNEKIKKMKYEGCPAHPSEPKLGATAVIEDDFDF